MRLQTYKFHLLFIPYFIFLVNSVGSADDSNGVCSANNELEENCDNQTSQKDWLSVGIIFVGIFTVGIGSTSIFSFGIPYVDDKNEEKYTTWSDKKKIMLNCIIEEAYFICLI